MPNSIGPPPGLYIFGRSIDRAIAASQSIDDGHPCVCRLAAGRSGWRHMLCVLRQVVGDGEPRRLGADEDVPARTDAGVVQKASQGDMDEGAVADDRIEQRAAAPAVRVVSVVVALDQEIVLALGEAELAALDAGERLEGRTRGPAAI